jgi:CRISPR-associated protein Cas1
LPNKEVDRIEIGPRASADSAAMALALASDTPLAFVNGWGETLGWLAPHFGSRAGRQLAQAGVVLDPERRLNLARTFVVGRLRNQRALLRRLNRTRKNPVVLKKLNGINQMIRRAPHEQSLASLMGVEGRATALYWHALGRTLKYGFRFSRRERQGNLNAVNIMLNMTAHMLTRDVTVCLVRAGLHPGFGVLHESRDTRDAMAFDLMEEFRVPLCESVVVSAINTRVVSPSMFTRRAGGGVRMGADATRALIRAYERAASRPVKSQRSGRRRMWRHNIAEQAFLLAAHIEGRENYSPYVMDY